MAEFSYQNFEREFSDSMIELEKAFQERNHLKTISYLRFLARSYYMINYKMADDRLEEITQQISFDFLGETAITDSNSNTVAFYDGFGQIDYVLAKIYIDALAQLGYETVWIIHGNAPCLEEIQQYCKEKGNVSFRIVPVSPILERMRHLQAIIKDISPKHLFFQAAPFDICGAGVFSTVKGDVTRYLVDMSDHTFWLGKRAADYFIGFRNWSYNVENQLRGISSEQLIILPYYPNSRARYAFDGMPFDTDRYEYIFSGGNPYKIEGDNTYQELVEHILINYPKLKFVYATYDGSGFKKQFRHPLLKYLERRYPGQFFRVPVRKDLDEVFKRAKLYLGTYPISGGLMTQYAVVNHCIPLCLEKEPGSIMDPRTFLLQPDKAEFVFDNKEALLTVLDKFLSDEQHLAQARSKLAGQVISEKEFTEELQCVLTEHQTKFKGKDMPIILDRFLATYRRRADYKMFCDTIYNSHNDWIKQKYPEIIERMGCKEMG